MAVAAFVVAFRRRRRTLTRTRAAIRTTRTPATTEKIVPVDMPGDDEAEVVCWAVAVGLELGAVGLRRVDSGLAGELIAEDTGVSGGSDGDTVDAFEGVPSRGTAVGVARDGASLEDGEDDDPAVYVGVVVADAIACVGTGGAVDGLDLGVNVGEAVAIGGGGGVVGFALLPPESGGEFSAWQVASSLSRM
jgi:hypothetical protein